MAFITPGSRLRAAMLEKEPVLSDTGKPGIAVPPLAGGGLAFGGRFRLVGRSHFPYIAHAGCTATME